MNPVHSNLPQSNQATDLDSTPTTSSNFAESSPVKKNPIFAIIITAFISSLVVGATVYFWQNSTHVKTSSELGDELSLVNQKNGSSLPKVDESLQEDEDLGSEFIVSETEDITNEIMLADVANVVNLVIDCSEEKERDSKGRRLPIDKALISNFQKQNYQYDQYIQRGYKLKEVCKSGEIIFLFLDFETGYWQYIEDFGTMDEETRIDLEEKAIIGLIDINSGSMILYQVRIDILRLEGPGAGGGENCKFDSYQDNKIFYICQDGSLARAEKFWYVFDEASQQNNLVKHSEFEFDIEDWRLIKEKVAIFDDYLSSLFVEKN